jgi:hypothetical protein
MRWLGLGIFSFLFYITLSSEAKASTSFSFDNTGQYSEQILVNPDISNLTVLKSASVSGDHKYTPFLPFILPSSLPFHSVEYSSYYFPTNLQVANPRIIRLKTGLSPPQLPS